jgi:hypothetical protein
MSRNGQVILKIQEVIKEFSEIYWDFFTEKDEIYPVELKNSKLLKIIDSKNYKKIKNLNSIELKNVHKITEKFLKKYMFGALYEDTKGIFFGFSKEKDELYINQELIFYMKEKLIKEYTDIIKNEINLFLGTSKKTRRRKNMIYYQQKFGFEMNYIDLFTENKDLLQKTKSDLSIELGIGIPKIDSILQYLEFSDVIRKNEITLFGNKIKEMKSNYDFIEPIVYYNMVKNPEFGGHYIYSNLINIVIYEKLKLI